MLAAGHETTATGLAFAFDLLMRHPAVMAGLRDELESGDRRLSRRGRDREPRLRPVIDAVERTLAKPRTVCGWDLPAGIRVYPAIALVHRREDIYPQAHEFRPERFLDADTPSYAWLPFGGGIRRCIGAALAQAEMAEVITAVVRRRGAGGHQARAGPHRPARGSPSRRSTARPFACEPAPARAQPAPRPARASGCVAQPPSGCLAPSGAIRCARAGRP